MATVLVLGGGFGGIAAAVALRDRLDPGDRVVLVDRRDDFVMGLRKTWYLLGMSPLAYGTRHLAGLRDRGIEVLIDEVTSIDPGRRSARVGDQTIEADALVVALGAAHGPSDIPGLAVHGHDVWSLDGIEHAAAAIDAFPGGRAVVGIFGTPYSCPPAPYELALLLADRFAERGIDGELTVFGPSPITLPILGAAGCATLDAQLAERGITYLAAHTARVVSAREVELADGERLPFELLLAVPPHRAPSVLVDAGLAAADGWVRVDRSTMETAYPGVYAIGDCTAIGLSNGLPLPKAGLFAEREGEIVADRFASVVRGEPATATFDGSGACFIETGGGRASTISGDFFADPPAVTLSEPSSELREEKERFEAERLARWFGA